MKFGRRRPIAPCPHARLRNYLLKAGLPAAPPSSDYTAEARASIINMYLNDRLGDCVIAGGYHVIGVATGNADGGTPFVATDTQILADYGAIGGYNPADPSTDQGCDEQTALNYWTSSGFADGSKLSGWVGVDAGNQAEVASAMWLFENLFFGIELPDAWVSPMPDSSGFVWDVAGDPDPNNGHCVVGVGHNAQGVQIATWGMVGTITYAAIAKYCTALTGGGLYVLLTPDQIAAGYGKAPNGVAWGDLIADLASLGGAPAPAPAPAPAATVTLGEAQQWASQGLSMNWPSGR